MHRPENLERISQFKAEYLKMLIDSTLFSSVRFTSYLFKLLILPDF